MKKLLSKIVFLTSFLFALIFLSACNQDDNILLSEEEVTTDQQALEKIIDQDESIQSFDINYNEEQVMDFVLGKTAEEIYPVKVGQRMKLVERNLNIVFEGDTARGTLTKTFEGVLFIAASLEPLDGNIDSLDLNVYEKPFSTTITRNVVFVKVDNSEMPLRNWKLSAISLPVGGTLTENISIEKLIVYLPSGETLEIESPLDYYLSRGPSLRRLIPILTQFEQVGVEVVIKSTYSESDFVTLTYGAIKNRRDARGKRRLEMVDENYDGTYYTRVYKGDWVVHQMKGFRHAVINAMPYGVLKDSEAPVESNSWGIPYAVN